MNDQQQKQFWFNGIFENKTNLFVTFAIFAFQFLIWKLRKTEKGNFKLFYHGTKLAIYSRHYLTHRLSNKIREAVLLINFDICRRWHG
jgi:hypothetical protein